jgi:methionyl-tRNA formyltransferase
MGDNRLMSAKKGRYVVCAYREWNVKLFNEKFKILPHEFYLISSKDELTIDRLDAIDPEFIFFLDWSWIVPSEIFTRYKCIVFHAAPLPEFRGGSPIQNQIIRGIKETRLTAFIMDGGIDTGDILIQENLSLEGHLKDIFNRISKLSYRMVVKIIEGKYSAKKQEGKGSKYRRRKPEESELKTRDMEKPLEWIYDFIRMLEDPYPNAFIVVGAKKIAFKKADYDSSTGTVRVSAEITNMEA